MAGLKSFLYGVAPTLGTTGAALYERQRALVNLKVLKPIAGRGPGSGVPLTGRNVAAVLISVLAAETLTEVDERVVSIINAVPEVAIHRLSRQEDAWVRAGKPLFCDAIGALLAGAAMPWPMENKRSVHEIRITRCWRGQLVTSPSGASPTGYVVDSEEYFHGQTLPIKITAAIDGDALAALISFTRGALSQVAAEEDDE